MNKNIEDKLKDKDYNLMDSYLRLAEKVLDVKSVEKAMILLMRFKLIYNPLGIYNKKLDDKYEQLFERYKDIRYSNQSIQGGKNEMLYV